MKKTILIYGLSMAALVLLLKFVDYRLFVRAISMEVYQDNTAFRLGITFMEIFSICLLISLVCALIFGVILKPKAPEVVGS